MKIKGHVCTCAGLEGSWGSGRGRAGLPDIAITISDTSPNARQVCQPRACAYFRAIFAVNTVLLTLLSLNGLLTPVSDARKKSDQEWRAALSPLEYDVLRCGGTERPFTGEYTAFYPDSGHFACKGCETPLYSAQSKFESSCGWPAFDKAYAGSVRLHVDSSHGMTRWEILCAGCDGHLGHVFSGERYTETSQRHCVNSVSVIYGPDPVDQDETAFDFAQYGDGKDTN